MAKSDGCVYATEEIKIIKVHAKQSKAKENNIEIK